jgi:hypothetical protein
MLLLCASPVLGRYLLVRGELGEGGGVGLGEGGGVGLEEVAGG